jgi:hypothetical protein
VFNIYEAINTGSTAHSRQQIRRAAFMGPYIRLLLRLSERPSGKKLAELHGLTDSALKKQEDQEYMLRFAFYSSSRSTPLFKEWESRPSIKVRWR